MAPVTKVQLRLGDRIVAEVPWRGDELRIGRMKENDLVINNLAVSRFHAVLRRVGDGFEIQDLDSENGTLLDGVRVEGTRPLAPGAELTVGKHTLVLRDGEQAAAPVPPTRKSDAWDAAQTYFAPELAARALPRDPPSAAPAVPSAPDEEAVVGAEGGEDVASTALAASSPAPREATAHHLPDPAGLFAFGEEDLALAPPAVVEVPARYAAEFDVAAAEVAPAAAEAAPAAGTAGGQTALFDFGATDDLGLSDPSLARMVPRAPESTSPPAPAAAQHAGVIVERAGRVEQVQPFAGGELVVGRGPNCDLVLRGAGVSRRHARFVGEGECFRVLDLGSANGVRVNGERVREQELRVGDVVAIDDYTLTFVIDNEPLDRVVQSGSSAAAGSRQVTVLHDAPLAQLIEQDLVIAADDEAEPIDAEKELELSEVAAAAPRVAAEMTVGGWVVELSVSADQLPEPLRAALAALGTTELRLPAELKLRPKR
jgi:pSer/pThr/pTyr-binding forkhead associated (FHA) protein